MPTSIIDALNDPQLMGASFPKKKRLLGGKEDTYKAWKACLAALFALSLDPEALALYQRHTGRLNAPTSPFNEAHLIIGRRGGKSRAAAAVAVYLACFKTYDLAPGETGVLPVIAADRKQAGGVFSYINGILDNSPILSGMVVNRFKESIELNNRTRIEVFTSSYVSVRGRTLIGAVVDEEAFLQNSTESANADVEVFNALRPGMATIPGAILLGISSPYAKRGELWRNFKEHYGKDDSPVLVWRATSREMNPELSKAFIAAAYLRDASSARAEFGGEFRDDIESFISIEVVESCTVRNRRELPPTGERYVAFVDPSGGSSDSMTLAVAHFDEKRKLAVLDMVRETFAPFSPEKCVEEQAKDLKRYDIHEVTGDHYAGEWPREQFQKHGIMYRLSELTRSELYLELLPGLMSAQCELLDNDRLKNQLANLERRTARSGKDSVDHAPGSQSHDDVANAAAGALVAAMHGGVGYGLVEHMKQLIEKSDQQKAAAILQQTQPLPPCSACGSSCVVRKVGVGIMCNQCGATDSSAVPRSARHSRRDVPFARDWRDIGR